MPKLSRIGFGQPTSINTPLAKKPRGFYPKKIETEAFVEYRALYQETVTSQQNL